MGKKKTTQVTNTGLGDGQFDTLSGNQQTIADSIDENQTAAVAANNALLEGQLGIQTGVTDLASTQAGGFSTIGQANAAAVAEAKEREKRITAAIAAQPTVDLSGLTAGQTKIGTDMATGFGVQGERFDSVDEQLKTANQGIIDANTGITGLGTGQVAIAEGVAGGFETSAENQAGLKDGQKDYYEKAQSERDALKKAVLAGQVDLTALVNKYGEQGKIFYEALAAEQKKLVSGQSGIQDGLDAFQGEYQQDFQDQGKFLGELKQSITGGFNTTNTNIGETAGGLSTQVSNFRTGLGNDLKSNFDTIAGGQFNSEMLQSGFDNNTSADFDYGSIATSIYEATAGFATGADVSGLKGNFDKFGNDVTGQFDAFGTALEGGFDQFGNIVTGDDLNALAGNYDEFGNDVRGLFDEQGKTLIGGFDKFGNKVKSNFNELGEDVTGKFDEFGKALEGGFDEFGNKLETNNETVGGYIDEMGKFVRADISKLEVTTMDGQKALAGNIADGTVLLDGSVKEGNRIISADQVKMRDAFTGKLDEVNNILTSQDSQLSSELRQQYMNLSQSFDEKGALIEESVDENGLRTNRAIDKQGNLILAQFDQTGKRISQSNLNINDLIKGMNAQKYTGGANYEMGTPSPAYNARMGLMGPYTSTAGTPQYGQ